jgi:aspartate racemase
MGPAPDRPVGILGGMGPLATSAFYEAVIRATEAAVDQDHLHLIIDADPAIPDRTAFLLGRGPDPRPRLIAAAQRLRAAGVSMAGMPCNTAYTFADEIRAASGLELVPWIESAVEGAISRGCTTVGILATEGTIEAGLYQAELSRRGAAAVVPDEAEQALLTEAIYGPGSVKARGGPTSQARAALLEAGRRLLARGAQCLIMGCTELPMTVSVRSPRWGGPVIDPAPLVARRLVSAARGQPS